MKSTFTKISAGAALACAALLTMPALAQATEVYPDQPTSSVSKTAELAGGDSVTFSVDGLVANGDVEVAFTGSNAQDGAITQAKLGANSNTLTKTLKADANGKLSFSVTLPENAACDYTVSGAQGDWAKTWTLSTPCADGAGSAAAAGAKGLANTGGASLAWAGAGAGALVLVGGAVAAAAVARKKRATA
ncbi:hypothetical protein [Leucobacter sp. USHLN153]|uniref:hypothetical protein n=1 Tax=Leucobacter sp. USHLN153 TaxID=3081268 RepID=UPI003016462E